MSVWPAEAAAAVSPKESLADVLAAVREQSAADTAAPGPEDVHEMSAIASCWRYTSYFWSTAVLIFAVVVLYWDVSTAQLLLRPYVCLALCFAHLFLRERLHSVTHSITKKGGKKNKEFYFVGNCFGRQAALFTRVSSFNLPCAFFW